MSFHAIKLERVLPLALRINGHYSNKNFNLTMELNNASTWNISSNLLPETINKNNSYLQLGIELATVAYTIRKPMSIDGLSLFRKPLYVLLLKFQVRKREQYYNLPKPLYFNT